MDTKESTKGGELKVKITVDKKELDTAIEPATELDELVNDINHKLVLCYKDEKRSLRRKINKWLDGYHPKFYICVLLFEMLALIFSIIVLIYIVLL